MTRSPSSPWTAAASTPRPRSSLMKYGTSAETRDTKKAFNAVKVAVAERFLAELDEVTEGQLVSLWS